MHYKHTFALYIIFLFRDKGQERIKKAITLVDPVVLLVGRDRFPIQTSVSLGLLDEAQFVFTREVVANVVIMYLTSV